MAETTETRTKVVRIVYDASKARDGARDARRSLEEIEKAAQQSHGALGRLEAGFGKLTSGFAFATRAAGVFGVALSIGAAANFAKELMQTVGGLGAMAEQLTTNTRYLQALQFAATGANVKLADLEVGSAALSRRIGQAAEGNKDAIETFQRLGVKILDARGNVRPFNDLLVESASALDKVENANTKAALSYEVFDKAGRKMLTLLPEIAKGEQAVTSAAEKFSTVISPETIEKWDKLGSAVEQQGLKWKAFAAENFLAPVSAAFRVLAFNIELTLAPLKALLAGIDALKGAGDWLGGLFTTGPKTGDSTQETLERIEYERVKPGTPAGDAVNRRLDNDVRRVLGIGGQGFSGTEPMDLATKYKPPSSGSRDPVVKGTGESEGKRYAQLIAQLEAAAAAQDNMTAASRRGETAFQEQQVKVAATEKAIAIYGKALEETDPRLRKIIELMQREMQGKAAATFNVATTELQKQNVLLQAELDLAGQLPEIRARELSIIKAKQEAEKAGSALTAEDIERRRQAIEQNERLKIQAEELKRAQELWTEPLKQALRDIQTTGADAFQQMLESGNFSFEALGQTFKRIITRMAAEFLALATIRPVMSVIVNAISPSIARQMGMGASSIGGGGGVGASGGAGGGLSLPSFGGGGIGSLFGGGIADFLGTPLTGAYAGMSPSSMAGLPVLGSGGLSGTGITVGAGLGALAGAGMGIYQLATAKSTGQTIGGIASLVGAGVSLIPGVGQIAGPLIALAGSLLPGLFGEEEKIPPRPPLQYGGGTISAGAFGYSGDSLNNGSPLVSTARGIGTTVNDLFKRAGLTAVPGQLIGGSIASGVNNIWNAQGKSWQGQNYTQTGLQLPGGGFEQLTYNDTGRDLGAASDYLAAQIFKANVLRGGVTGSANIATAIGNANPQSLGEIEKVVDAVKAFDEAIKNFGKTTTDAEQAITQIDRSFEGLYETANKYGLDTGVLTAEQGRQRFKVANDFGTSLDQQLLAIRDPAAAAVAALDREREALIDNNRYIVERVNSSMDQIAKIEALYGEKRKQIADDVAQAQIAAAEATRRSVEGLEDIARRLRYGDLSTASPDRSLSGTEGAYKAALAQSRAGDANATANLPGFVAAYAESARSYYGSAGGFQAINDRLQADVDERIAALGAPASGGSSANGNAANNAVLQSNAELRNMVASLLAELSRTREELSAATAAMRRAG